MGHPFLTNHKVKRARTVRRAYSMGARRDVDPSMRDRARRFAANASFSYRHASPLANDRPIFRFHGSGLTLGSQASDPDRLIALPGSFCRIVPNRARARRETPSGNGRRERRAQSGAARIEAQCSRRRRRAKAKYLPPPRSGSTFARDASASAFVVRAGGANHQNFIMKGTDQGPRAR